MAQIIVEVFAFTQKDAFETARGIPGFKLDESRGATPVLESTYHVYGEGPLTLSPDDGALSVQLDPDAPAKTKSPAGVRLRVKIFGGVPEVHESYIALVAENTGFVPDADQEFTADDNNTWWVIGTGPADMKHDFVREVQVLKRLRVKIFGAQPEVVDKYVALVSVNTGFTPDPDQDYTLDAKKTCWVTGTGPAEMKHDFVREVQVLPAEKPAPQPAPAPKHVRLRVAVYGWGQQILDSAREIASQTAFVLDDPIRTEPQYESTCWVYGTGPADLKHDLIQTVEVLPEGNPVKQPASPPAGVKLRICVRGMTAAAAAEVAREIGRETAFVLDEPAYATPGRGEILWWFKGTGPADLKHELIYKLELVTQDKPASKPAPGLGITGPGPCGPRNQPRPQPPARRLKLLIEAASALQATLTAKEVAGETRFVLDEKAAPQEHIPGVWSVYGSGPAGLQHELVSEVQVLDGRLKLVIPAKSARQALLTARAVQAATKFVLDEQTPPAEHGNGRFAVHGSGPSDVKHELVESVEVVG